MSSSNSLTLPVITVQHTYPDVIHEVKQGIIPSEKFWVSCYKIGEQSFHGKVYVELDEVNRDLVVLKPEEEGLEVQAEGKCAYKISCKSLGIALTKVVSSIQNYCDPERSNSRRPQRITAFDISPDSSRFATGYLDGTVLLYPTTPLPSSLSPLPQSITTAKGRTISRPHLSSVISLKFFPSSRVLLSSGLDFSLNILPADLPDFSATETRVTPARTLRAHTRSVTSTAIISVGRNIVSSSLDSTIKLWDVSSGSVITSISSAAPILCMRLGDRMPTPPDGEESPVVVQNDLEVPETQSKVVFCGLQNGSYEQLDLGSKRSVYRSSVSSSSPVTSIAYSDSCNLLATGSSTGLVTLYDIRSLDTPLTSFSRTEGGVEDLDFTSTSEEVGLAIATTDGLPYIASIIPEGPGVAAELIGVDCDPVRNIRVRGGEIWSASDDGIVRRYIA
ncbi:hypothetical protein K443DRAFT_680870 [Laccaria amethystina LaAM-08-1]|uniref:WD40 repeat-like protein n=1 Tax=Laccaria amethystina LaAM-08-1 TaxID=1095629 RepID=A0A0C9XQQ2_9AGAR|nr:hypothetical protein K443DRAFT_680870 [Laccaria amethystina LaAM-08-1]